MTWADPTSQATKTSRSRTPSKQSRTAQQSTAQHDIQIDWQRNEMQALTGEGGGPLEKSHQAKITSGMA